MDEKNPVFKTLAEITDKTAKALDAYKSQVATLTDRIEELEAKQSAPGGTGAGNKHAKTPEVKAFETFIRTGDRTAVETKEMSIGGGAAAGGAMVPEIIADAIVSRAIARSRLTQLVRQTGPVSADYVRLVNLRGATASWSSETATRNATATPLLREVRPTHGELYAYPAITRWLAQDAKFDVSQFMTDNVSDVFAKSLEYAVILGDGSDKPTGMLNTSPVTTADGASPERSADAIQYVAGTADLADDIISLYFALKPEYRARGSWVISSASLAIVRKLRDPNGSGFLWQANLSAGVDATDGTLLGKPVVISEYMPAASASPLVDSILFGDFDAGYELVRIGGMVMLRDEITTPGKIKLYTAQRFGGRLVDNDAIKALRA
jgi:HK97 family phage major capsid protein